MAENFYTSLTHHFFEILGFVFLLLLGLESFCKHLRPVLEVARLVYLDMKSWKTSTSILPPKT
jgi:hypothetical protein